MKTLKTTILGLFIALTFTAAKANTTKDATEGYNGQTVSYDVNTYINAVTRGRLSDIGLLLDDNMKYTIERNGNVYTYKKSDFIKSLWNAENVKQNCVTTASVETEEPGEITVEVDMKYADFTRTNYVTLDQSNDGDWKITNIYSAF